MRGVTYRENLLADDHDSTKEKVVNVVGKDSIDDSNAIQISKFSFGLTRSLCIVNNFVMAFRMNLPFSIRIQKQQ